LETIDMIERQAASGQLPSEAWAPRAARLGVQRILNPSL
jgi:hypothetical protein